MLNKDILSMREISPEEIWQLLQEAAFLKENPPKPILHGKILASCFFEPSTRTQFSFSAAMKKLGGDVIGFSDAANTSIKKGESLHDMMKVMSSYCDVIVIRHPEKGAAHIAAEASFKPVINAGDGDNEHPTQTLSDLFTIWETQKRLNNLNILIMGDLKYGRTAHSLALALRHFKNHLFLVSSSNLSMPLSILECLNSYSCHEQYEEVIDKADIVYVTRLQEERLRLEHEKHSYALSLEGLKRVKQTMKILHPLPRLNEIPREIDLTAYAHYFPQAENSIFVRMAILRSLLC